MRGAFCFLLVCLFGCLSFFPLCCFTNTLIYSLCVDHHTFFFNSQKNYKSQFMLKFDFNFHNFFWSHLRYFKFLKPQTIWKTFIFCPPFSIFIKYLIKYNYIHIFIQFYNCLGWLPLTWVKMAPVNIYLCKSVVNIIPWLVFNLFSFGIYFQKHWILIYSI